MVCLSIIGNYLFASAQVNEVLVRRAVFDTLNYYAQLPTVERTGRNDHWAIHRFTKKQKGIAGRPWCSDFQLYGYHSNFLFIPGVNGTAYSWRKNKRLVFWPAMLKDMDRVKRSVRMMDMIVFSFSHVEGFIELDPRGLGVYSIGGNTKGGRNREGAYYPIFRRWSFIPSIYDHITPYVAAHGLELVTKKPPWKL